MKPPEKQEAHQQHAERLLKRTQPLSTTQLQEQKKKLKPTEKQQKREIALSPWEKAVESRRSYFAYSDDEQDFSDYEQDWETEGSGFSDEAEKLINQLHLSLGSIKAGNNSIKLKKRVFSLRDSPVELGVINKKEKKKLFLII